MEPPEQFDWTLDITTILYCGVSILLGSVASVAYLMGDKKQEITPRVLFAYMLMGGTTSLGTVLIVMQWVGMTPFLLGLGLFAGFQAFQTASIIAATVGKFITKHLGGSK